MIMGVITALVVVFSQVFYFQASNYAKKEVKSGQEKKQDKQSETDNHYTSLPSISQPTTATHVEADHESSFLLEILFEDKEEPTDLAAVPLSLGKFFHTLFRVIISPNAP
jgi:hypothetical protein